MNQLTKYSALPGISQDESVNIENPAKNALSDQMFDSWLKDVLAAKTQKVNKQEL